MAGAPKRSRIHGSTGAIIGSAAAAFLLLILAVIVSRLVVIWCPRGADCEEMAQLLYWSGMALSAGLASIAGLAVRDFVNRRSDGS